MKLDIVRSSPRSERNIFEVEDLRAKGQAFIRTWSSFCALVPGDPNGLQPLLKQQLAGHHYVDLVPAADGVWLVAGTIGW